MKVFYHDKRRIENIVLKNAALRKYRNERI